MGLYCYSTADVSFRGLKSNNLFSLLFKNLLINLISLRNKGCIGNHFDIFFLIFFNINSKCINFILPLSIFCSTCLGNLRLFGKFKPAFLICVIQQNNFISEMISGD